MELRGKYTLIAEGSRGSLAKQLIARFRLDESRDPQKYGIGLKELWQVDPGQFRPGLVQHGFGWPLTSGSSGGAFLYHYDDNLVSVGFVVHLNYANPTLSPFDEFQRFKTHPMIAKTFAGGKRLAYGARAISGGGWQSVPKLSFPGGALIGCAAGFLNFARIKGVHNAILSGMLAAEKVHEALGQGRANDELVAYEGAWRGSDIGRDLHKVRNVKPLWKRLGLTAGMALGGFDMWTNELAGVSFFGTLKHGKPDSDTLKPLSVVTPIVYPKPDGVVSFDKLSSVFLSNTNHEEDQPIHLRLKIRPFRSATTCRSSESRRPSTALPGCTRSSTRHCHVGDFYLSTARSGHRPQTGKSMAWRVPAWYWTPPESAILGQRDNARRIPALTLSGSRPIRAAGPPTSCAAIWRQRGRRRKIS